MYFTVILRSEATENPKTAKFATGPFAPLRVTIQIADDRRQMADDGSAVPDDPLNHLIRLVPRHLLLEEKAKVSTNQAFSLRRRGTACGG